MTSEARLTWSLSISLAIAAVILFLLWAVAKKPWILPVQMTDPGAAGIRIEMDGILGNFYPASSDELCPAVLIFGGSEGGLSVTVTRHAQALQKAGYSTFHFSWWRAPEQAQRIENIPIECFEKALDWLKAQETVDPERVAVFGWSRGSEAAQLLAIRHPEIRAVVLGMPANAVWPGFDWNFLGRQPSFAWTSDGQPYPTIPRGAIAGRVMKAWTTEQCLHYSRTLETAPSALIQIEKVEAPVLIICGEADRIWPSCWMSKQLMDRACAFGKDDVQLLAYAGAGHMAYGAPVSPDDPAFPRQSKTGGGDLETNRAALQDSFAKTLVFLNSSLGK